MARAAFVMDRFMSLIGLHGKSFLPMLVGFGCNVPGIYATRTLDNEQDRKITAFLTTFMSCGARLPVYVIFGAAFFGESSGNLIFGMYLLGIGIAVLTSLLLTKIVYRNKPLAPFVMELPPYRVPDMRSVTLNMWQRTVAFIRKAGTIILMASIAIWLLLAIPINANVDDFAQVEPQNSVFGSLSKGVAPALAPTGYGEWEASGSLITGLVAKEVIITSMTQVYVGDSAVVADETSSLRDDAAATVTGFGEATLLTVEEIVNIAPRAANLLPGVNMPEVNLLGRETVEEDHSALAGALRDHFTPLAAVAFSVFVLLYVPCMSAIGAMRHEFGPRWMAIHIIYTLGMAWFVATLVYQGGRLLGWGG
jgi:ferrous iron transport protein B